ncbi:MAG: sialate O-acetylesterase [Flavobacteriaceae bacterium]|nr:sialate O-acetylesterase [Flavobacteriaceae bacterium]|tara:strand:+ start:5095 stop:6696 length:1602 start_codon:yes stop_codon:yes gene_type:complete
MNNFKLIKQLKSLNFVMFLLLAGNTSLLFAEVRLPNIFSDNMVLQQGVPVRIWGWADAGEKVNVTFLNQKKTTIANAEGKWLLFLDELEYGGPFELVVSAKNTIKFSNILVGEVWICSGQSNMEWPVSLLNNPKEVESKADYPNIRFFKVKHSSQGKPADDCAGQWDQVGPQTVSKLSAVGYFFSRELHSKLNVPIGLINSTWSGSAAESWVRRDVLDADPAYSDIIERHNADLKKFKSFKNIVSAYKQFETEYVQWAKADKQAKKEGKPRSDAPAIPTCQPPNFLPAGLYNGMITPLQKFAIKGVIWYQGESNAFDVVDGSDGVHRAIQYGKLFPELIECWRKDWGLGEFPFYYVQIAPFGDVYKPKAAALIRQAQFETLRKVENTGMAVTMDIGNVKDIHPRNKHDVGKRLSLWALAKSYGQDIVYSGPLYRDMKIEKNKIILSFDHVGGGLIARDSALNFFFIAGKNKQFYPAKAEIKGGQVIVFNKKVKRPVAVRFAFSNDVIPNFYNKEGLPASPFRTDDWDFSETNR